MTRRIPTDPKPRWLRLTPEAWALIRDAYISGATAPELAHKWRVSRTSIYRHASDGGWTKRAAGAAFAAARVEAERKSSAARRDEAEALAARLPDVEADPGGFAAGLGRSALVAIRPAMDEGRIADAKGYAVLAEHLRKLSARERAAEARRPSAAQQQESLDAFVAERWRYIAEIACAMIYNPEAAPALFEQHIAAWRREHLGEDEAASAARAPADAARAFDFHEAGFGPAGDIDALAAGFAE
jgi:hypothetical protein